MRVGRTKSAVGALADCVRPTMPHNAPLLSPNATVGADWAASNQLIVHCGDRQPGAELITLRCTRRDAVAANSEPG